ncbi:MAG: preprotein translocase subunit SecG [Lachnospiraceae bacterium]|nr:preprotein translocase subunit SecG [Lachnospiraceae bacterium]
MSALRILVSIVYIIVSVALVILVLMQEGKAQGLGTISGAADSYWGKNKGRSMEGMLVKITRILAIAFLVLTALLNMKIF